MQAYPPLMWTCSRWVACDVIVVCLLCLFRAIAVQHLLL